MWRIEYLAGGGWFFPPEVIYREWKGEGREPGEVASFANRFPTKSEARRVARMVNPKIEVRFVKE